MYRNILLGLLVAYTSSLGIGMCLKKDSTWEKEFKGIFTASLVLLPWAFYFYMTGFVDEFYNVMETFRTHYNSLADFVAQHVGTPT